MSVRAAISLLLLCAGAAHADPTEADRTFELGRDKLARGEYAEACAAFETSERLDPQLGTRFNLAQCSAALGKLTEALAIYADLAAHDTNAQRKAVSAKLAAELAARVPHIHLRIAHGAPDLVVTLDGVDVTARIADLELDVGAHVVVTRQGDARTTTPVEVRAEAANFEVAIDAIAPATPPSIIVPAAPEPARSRRAYVAVAVSGATLAGGAVLGLLAHSSWNDAQAAAARGDIPSANTLADRASTRGDLSTGLFVVGGLTAAAGVALYLTSPHGEHATRITAAPARGGGGLAVSGSF